MKFPGFSLIELLVVVAIMLAISGLSLVGYNSFQERQVVNRAVENLSSDLRLAQQKAISGAKTSGWCTASSDSLQGWRINFTSATTYVVEGVCCTNIACTTTSTSPAAKTVSLTGVTKSGGSTVLFTTSQGSTSSAQNITLTGTGMGASAYAMSVSVSSAGGVSSVVGPTPTPTLLPTPTSTPQPTPTPDSRFPLGHSCDNSVQCISGYCNPSTNRCERDL